MRWILIVNFLIDLICTWLNCSQPSFLCSTKSISISISTLSPFINKSYYSTSSNLWHILVINVSDTSFFIFFYQFLGAELFPWFLSPNFSFDFYHSQSSSISHQFLPHIIFIVFSYTIIFFIFVLSLAVLLTELSYYTCPLQTFLNMHFFFISPHFFFFFFLFFLTDCKTCGSGTRTIIK